MSVWLSQDVWAAVASELSGHRQQGLAGLLTEDTVRFAAVKALADAGVSPGDMMSEWPHPVLKGSRIDLVIGRPPAALIEFKYPREPEEKNAAWTMALGEILKDLYRLASFPGTASRLFVYVETTRLHRYMAGAAQKYGLDLNTQHVVLRPSDAARLPGTAARIIGTDLAAHHVTAQRTALLNIDNDLKLAVYSVEPLGAQPASAAEALLARTSELQTRDVPMASSEADTDTPVSAVGHESATASTRDGARHEILAAISAVLSRSQDNTFTPTQIAKEMTRRGTGYAESTIRTMITAHMCSNAPDNAATTYDDLERIDRGTYRLKDRSS